ncbi:MAG TPA: radical SAM protein [Verrucomicrobiae bacterium]|nr:radical SAM protein [Verrucomicrobiae bacterium]
MNWNRKGIRGKRNSLRPERRFQLILIKPSHYDDDGYVIQWFRSVMPSNSLAALYGLAIDAAERQVLGPNVSIDVTPLDETNTRIKPKKIIAHLKRFGGFGLVGLVGVQSNQFPRAMDIARPLRAAGVPVVIGGFHISGCLSMLAEMQPDIQEALDLGISLFAGEAEERLDTLLRDAESGTLQPIYNHLNDLPSIQSAPLPFLLRKHVKRTAGNYTTFDAGRGCPYQCSFCTIINVQGRKSRRRSPDDVERIIRQNWAEGIHRFFITDDNLARNKDWEPILDRIIKLRTEEGIGVSLMIQVDALCHKIPKFIEKCAAAGVTRVFIGIESVNPDTLIAAKKRQNKISEYRKLLLAWKGVGAVTYAGYILGFPNDTPASISRDIGIIQRELPIDMMEFFCLTPLPGSEDHQILHRKGVAMDPDMNKYDTEHAVTAHSQMTRTEWEEIYRAAWDMYYSPEHLERIMRRAGATGINLRSLAGTLLHFSQFTSVENIHPLQGGILRLKFRLDRRPAFTIEPMWTFYPKYLWHSASKLVRVMRAGRHLYGLAKTIKDDPRKKVYMDQALTPAVEDDLDSLELFNQNDAARNSVRHGRHPRELTSAAAT